MKQPDCTLPSVEVEVNEDEMEYKKKVTLNNLVSEVTFWQKMWQRYSRWKSLTRAVQWVTLFRSYWMLMNTKILKGALTVGSLTVEEMHQAEIQLLKATQEQCFSTIGWLMKTLGVRVLSRCSIHLSHITYYSSKHQVPSTHV